MFGKAAVRRHSVTGWVLLRTSMPTNPCGVGRPGGESRRRGMAKVRTWPRRGGFSGLLARGGMWRGRTLSATTLQPTGLQPKPRRRKKATSRPEARDGEDRGGRVSPELCVRRGRRVIVGTRWRTKDQRRAGTPASYSPLGSATGSPRLVRRGTSELRPGRRRSLTDRAARLRMA